MTSTDRCAYTTFVGIDLGGARGKSTAVAELSRARGSDEVAVDSIHTRAADGAPWTDDEIVALASTLDPEHTVLAIAAPLTVPACIRCQVDACPGVSGCVDPAIVWLRTEGEALRTSAALADRDSLAATPASHGVASRPAAQPPPGRIAPYTHRCTEVVLHYRRDLVPRAHLGQGPGPIGGRGSHLRRVLAGCGFRLNENLLEVSPRSTVRALFGERRARGYKRDADPWETRAGIVEDISAALSFSPRSRLSREEVLRNDHCFDALLCGYTGFLWARDAWQLPAGGPFTEDGWIWAPPDES